MGMLDGLIEQLEKSPVVQNAMVQFDGVRKILVATVNRFDSRFGEADTKTDELNRKLDRILFILENPSYTPLAGEHVLALSENSEVQTCPVVGCTIQTIHEHGDGLPVVAHESETLN